MSAAPSMKPANSSAMSSKSGAASTSRCFMPVSRRMKSGSWRRGLTRVSYSSETPPAPNRTAPISMIRSVSDDSPVVSRSSATHSRCAGLMSASPCTAGGLFRAVRSASIGGCGQKTDVRRSDYNTAGARMSASARRILGLKGAGSRPGSAGVPARRAALARPHACPFRVKGLHGRARRSRRLHPSLSP